MERVNRENLDYTVETTYGLFAYICVHEEKFCTWEEAFNLFNHACVDDEVSACSVYYLDSKGHKRDVFTYTVPCDY